MPNKKRATNGHARRNGETENSGGETHQIAASGDPVLTTRQGLPVADDQNTLRRGERGPALLEDFHFREKIFHFDHERIPERVVHARGLRRARLLRELRVARRPDPGRPVPAGRRADARFVRFSTVAGNKGSPDLARDVRGFAVKLYTQQGNWDLVGNNIPVFFIQDPIKFPDLIHAAKQEPDRGFPQAQTAHDNFWDFVSLMPESTHMLMWAMSDRAIPRSFRFMEGFGVHTFRFVNADGRVDVREVPLEADARAAVGGVERSREDQRRRPRLPPSRPVGRDHQPAPSRSGSSASRCSTTSSPTASRSTCSTPTKLIPEEEVPIRPIGRLVLDRVVDNFFAETEQVAFCTQNIVDGIDFTNDPLLQGRNFSYLDTQLKRLGSPNFTDLPINAPKCPFGNFQQDGHMALNNPAGRVNYEPNSWPAEERGPREDPETGSGRSRTRRRARASRSGPRASPTTTARRASST